MNKNTSKMNEKWWCINFGQKNIDLVSAKKLQYFFKKISPHVVFGHQKVFIEVSQTKWSKSLYAFQQKLSLLTEKMNLNFERWQWGVGNSISESWIMARWKTLSPELLPLEAISDFINPLEVDKNKVNDNYRIKLLRSLGANSLQDLIEIPEDILLSNCGFWITEFTREHFSKLQSLRDDWLEKTTVASFFQDHKTFQLEDWIPNEYLQVA